MLAIVMFSAMFLSKPTFVQPQPWMEINQIDSDLPLTWMKYPNFLILPTDGSKGCVHPDVLYFPDGKDGYKFWMIYTPYPDNPQEQPFVVRSNDGTNWTDAGISNPVIGTGAYSWNYDHQADPAWCYIPEYDKFFLLWTVCPDNTTVNIAIAYSTDAQDWHFDAFGNNREPILVENAATPTIVYKNGIFHVWYDSGSPQFVEPVYYLTFQWDNTNNRVINQSSSQGPWFATSNDTGSIYVGYPYYAYCQGLSHVSVVCAGDYYYLYGSCYPAKLVNDPRYIPWNETKILHCWRGTSPLNFTDYGTLLSPTPDDRSWDNMAIYKSVLLTDCYGNLVTPNNQFWLYYSSYSGQPLLGNLISHIGLATAQQPIHTILGDINGDSKVDLQDLVLLAKAYGSKLGENNWNPNADIDGNNVVGLSDLVALAQHYGQHYP